MRLSMPVVASMLAAGLLAAAPSLAATIPYPNTGQLAFANNLTATADGTVTAYFAGSDASDNDTIELWDVTQGNVSGFVLPNHGSNIGDSTIMLTNVKKGDLLLFILDNTSTGQFEDSQDDSGTPNTWSTDGYNHAYSALYTGGIAGIPTSLDNAAIYVGMEDLAVTGLNPLSGSDLDYNDDTFVFTDVSINRQNIDPTPEPSSFVLFGTGLLGAAGVLRRKFVR
jgi:PEP-CTERM motif